MRYYPSSFATEYTHSRVTIIYRQLFIYTVSHKNILAVFCDNFGKREPISMITWPQICCHSTL